MSRRDRLKFTRKHDPGGIFPKNETTQAWKEKKPPLNISGLEKQPDEILINIVKNIPIEQVIKFCQTKKRFNEQICKNDNFWVSRLQKDFGITSRIYYQKYIEEYKRRNFYQIDIDDFEEIHTGTFLLPFEEAVAKVKNVYGNANPDVNLEDESKSNSLSYNDYEQYFYVKVTGPDLDRYKEAVSSKDWKAKKYVYTNIYESIKSWYHNNDFNSILKVAHAPKVKTPKNPDLEVLKIILKTLDLQLLEELSSNKSLMSAVEDLDIETIIKYCDGSSKFNNKVCENAEFWIKKFKKDFDKPTETYYQIYIKLYKQKHFYEVSFCHGTFLLPFEEAVAEVKKCLGTARGHEIRGEDVIVYEDYAHYSRGYVSGPDLDLFEKVISPKDWETYDK